MGEQIFLQQAMSNSYTAIIDPFDRGAGTGSRDATEDWQDTNTIFDNEWGSEAATTFFIETDVSVDEHLAADPALKRRAELHHGKYGKNRKSDIRQSYIENDCDAFFDVLEIDEQHRTEIKQLIKDIDISSNNFGGTRYEHIILAATTLVTNKALSRRAQRGDTIDESAISKRIQETDEFEELMDAVEMDRADLRRVRTRIRDEATTL